MDSVDPQTIFASFNSIWFPLISPFLNWNQFFLLFFLLNLIGKLGNVPTFLFIYSNFIKVEGDAWEMNCRTVEQLFIWILKDICSWLTNFWNFWALHYAVAFRQADLVGRGTESMKLSFDNHPPSPHGGSFVNISWVWSFDSKLDFGFIAFPFDFIRIMMTYFHFFFKD